MTDFLTEFKKQTNNKEPFYSFVDYFSIEVLKDFTYNEDLKFEDLPCSNHIQQKFHELFSKKHTDKIQELRKETQPLYCTNANGDSNTKIIIKNVIIKN